MFRRGLPREATDALLAGEGVLGSEILCDFINASAGSPHTAAYYFFIGFRAK